jgi:hypothetical protein
MIAEGNSTQARTGALAQARRRTCRRAEMPVAGRGASFPGPSRAGHGSGSRRSATVKPPSGLRATPHRPRWRAARPRWRPRDRGAWPATRLTSGNHDDTALALVRSDTIRLDPMLSRFSTGVFTAPVAIVPLRSVGRLRAPQGPHLPSPIQFGRGGFLLRPAPVLVARMGEKRHQGLSRFLPPFAAWLG